VTRVRGRGVVTGSGVVSAGETELRFTDLVVATGTSPRVPDLDGIAASSTGTTIVIDGALQQEVSTR